MTTVEFRALELKMAQFLSQARLELERGERIHGVVLALVVGDHTPELEGMGEITDTHGSVWFGGAVHETAGLSVARMIRWVARGLVERAEKLEAGL